MTCVAMLSSVGRWETLILMLSLLSTVAVYAGVAQAVVGVVGGLVAVEWCGE